MEDLNENYVSMYATSAEKKAKAVSIMKELNIFKAIIDMFRYENIVCLFDNYKIYNIEDITILNKIKELELKYNVIVYAVTHEYTDFGELYSFLVVPKYKEDWNELFHFYDKNDYSVYSYVWNKTNNECSEFGYILVRKFSGILKRIG